MAIGQNAETAPANGGIARVNRQMQRHRRLPQTPLIRRPLALPQILLPLLRSSRAVAKARIAQTVQASVETVRAMQRLQRRQLIQLRRPRRQIPAQPLRQELMPLTNLGVGARMVNTVIVGDNAVIRRQIRRAPQLLTHREHLQPLRLQMRQLQALQRRE